ncbi:MAG: hypothetical protein WAT71_15180, partial [Ignavibacteria bacterium]
LGEVAKTCFRKLNFQFQNDFFSIPLIRSISIPAKEKFLKTSSFPKLLSPLLAFKDGVGGGRN